MNTISHKELFELIKKYPNDADLGAAIRKIELQLNNDFPSLTDVIKSKKDADLFMKLLKNTDHNNRVH